MKFRTLLVLTLAALLGVTVLATLLSVSGVVERFARRELADRLERGRRVFTELQRYRQSLYRAESRAVADEPRLKAAVDTQELSQETVLGVAVDLRKAIQSDLFLLTDGTGHLIADVADPTASGFDLSKNAEVAAALASGDGSGIWTHGDHAYQVQAHRLSFGTTTVGAVVLGYELDDRAAETVAAQTGDVIVVELDGAPIAASRVDGGVIDRAALKAALAGAGEANEPVEVTLAGQRFLAAAAPLPGRRDGQRAMRYWVLASIDRALEAKQRIRRTLWGVVGLAGLFALVLALFVSRRLSRPIDALVAFTRRVSGGDLAARIEPAGARELETLGAAMNRMVEELGQARERLGEQQRMRKELEIATRLQMSILPKAPRLSGLDIAARMIPADEVGGDYYDLLPVGEGGGWIGIGDVAGHGLTAGVVMMMIQGIISSLVRERPDASPADLVSALNRVLYENIHERLAQDEHVTLTLLRYDASGKVRFAGAHEEMIVCRAAGGAAERIATPGTWVGAIPDVSKSISDGSFELRAGDLLVLYTDGVIQAMNGTGEQFGMDRLCTAIEERRAAPVEDICSHVLDLVARFQKEQVDDVTLLVMRYTGETVKGSDGRQV